MKPGLARLLRVILLAILVAFVGIQFVRPDRSNPVVTPELTLESQLNPPPEIARLIAAACNDCHSDTTRWPWYSEIAPFSWLVAHDVAEGREHLNFSRIGELRADKRAKILEEAAEEVSEGAMPLWMYTLAHRDARLSDDQRRQLSGWFASVGDERQGRGRNRGGR